MSYQNTKAMSLEEAVKTFVKDSHSIVVKRKYDIDLFQKERELRQRLEAEGPLTEQIENFK